MNITIKRFRDRTVLRVMSGIDRRETIAYKKAGAIRGLEMTNDLHTAEEFRTIISTRREWEKGHKAETLDADNYRAFWEHKTTTNYIELIYNKLKEKFPDWDKVEAP